MCKYLQVKLTILANLQFSYTSGLLENEPTVVKGYELYAPFHITNTEKYMVNVTST